MQGRVIQFQIVPEFQGPVVQFQTGTLIQQSPIMQNQDSSSGFDQTSTESQFFLNLKHPSLEKD